MNNVAGEITVRGTDFGVSGLLVQAYDTSISPDGRSPEEVAKLISVGKYGHSLGGTVTEKGAFALQFPDPKPIRSPEGGAPKRLNLSLVVLAPETPGVELAKRILLVTETRIAASPNEVYRITLPGELLSERSLPVRGVTEAVSDDPRAVLENVALEARRRDEIDAGLRTLAIERVGKEREATVKARDAWKESLLSKLNRTPALPGGRKVRYVAPGGDVVGATWEAVNDGLAQNVAGQASQTGYVLLTEEQVAKLKEGNGDSLEDLPATVIEHLIFRAGEDAPRTQARVREDPIVAACKAHRTAPPLMRPTTPAQPTGPLDPPEPETPLVFDPEDVGAQVSRLMETLAAPEHAATGLGRADKGQVEENVAGFILRKGPADLPAYYDFHSLQIAFDYVWQHAIDDGVLALGEKAFRTIEELGGDPTGALKNDKEPIRALHNEMNLVLRAQQAANPISGMASVGGIEVMARRPQSSYDPVSPDKGERPPTPPPLPPRPPRPFPGGIDIDANMVVALPDDPRDLLAALEQRLRQPYAFTIFAPGSVNFGILVNYRQCWDPGDYQPGALLKTLTLTPGESRKYSVKTVVKKRRAVKEAETNQSSQREESDSTMRDEAEIVARAEARTNFNLTTQGSYKLGPIAEGDATTSFTRDVASSSQETKRAFREAVVKAARERRDETKREVEVEDVFDQEISETHEIHNKNEEISVAYLFYELQRRFSVTEVLHRVTPVALVAQPVPAPHEIDYDWLIAHDWIIKRFLPDDSFLPALNYLSRVRGDELALDHLRYNMDTIRVAVTQLRENLVEVRNRVSDKTRALEDAVASRISSTRSDSGLGNWISDFFTEDEDSVEAARLKEDFARETYERMVKEEKELMARLEREVTALQSATDAYAKAYSENVNQKIQIARLALHVKNNIYTFMHGIWSYEHPHQLFFRLHDIKAPRLKADDRKYTLRPLAACPLGVNPQPGKTCYEVQLTINPDPLPSPDADFATLAELTRLGQPLGFIGNLAILPLKESNALTDYMMMPYVDSELGLRDPDEFGNWTLEEFVRYVDCLRETMEPDQFDLIAGQLEAQYAKLLSSPRRDKEEIIVPTNSVFIEALPGKHPVLEDFKLLHRAIDVKKALAEVRRAELENVRLAARLMKNEREDPDIDRKIVIEGGAPVIVTPPDV